MDHLLGAFGDDDDHNHKSKGGQKVLLFLTYHLLTLKTHIRMGIIQAAAFLH